MISCLPIQVIFGGCGLNFRWEIQCQTRTQCFECRCSRPACPSLTQSPSFLHLLYWKVFLFCFNDCDLISSQDQLTELRQWCSQHYRAPKRWIHEAIYLPQRLYFDVQSCLEGATPEQKATPISTQCLDRLQPTLPSTKGPTRSHAID